MADGAIMRSEYLNVSTGTVRGGPTGHGESLTDVEGYLLPMERARGAGLHSWGVIGGLTVSSVAGGPGLTVTPGSALDAAGRTILLAAGGAAITDPTVDPTGIENIPTVQVSTDGVPLPTADADPDSVLTVTWREILSTGVLANGPVLLHAPWLRLLPAAMFPDDGTQVVLARVTLDGVGNVTGLGGQDRRLAGTPAGRLELRIPRTQAALVDQQPAAEFVGRPDGGLELNLLAGGGSRQALRVDAASLDLVLGAALRLAAPPGGRDYQLSSAADGRLRVVDAVTQAERLAIDAAGNVAIGTGGAPAQRTLHVEGSGIHTAGPAGGYSFATRGPSAFVESPTHGERWVWYAQDGTARLSSGSNEDILTISPKTEMGYALDVARRMRVRQGSDSSAGVWLRQNGVDWESALVGMWDSTHVGFWGNTGAGWGLLMDTSSGNVRFKSRVEVFGELIKGGGGFRIDHPLDPREKYLSHSFVESPGRLNVYVGVVETDDEGRATVQLPDFFEALNRDYTYQLTPIGEPGSVAVAEPVRDNAFTIQAGQPRVAVSWQVTGVRQDAWAAANPLIVEEDKPDDERDMFLHPEVHGEPETRHVFAAMRKAGQAPHEYPDDTDDRQE